MAKVFHVKFGAYVVQNEDPLRSLHMLQLRHHTIAIVVPVDVTLGITAANTAFAAIASSQFELINIFFSDCIRCSFSLHFVDVNLIWDYIVPLL